MRHVRWISTVLTLALSLAVATPVLAATVPALDNISTSSTAGGGGRTVIVSGTLPGSVSLPATIVLPVPKGTQPNWVGEIVGTDPSADPTAKYEIQAGDTYDTIVITVTKSRTGQAEFSLPATGASGDSDQLALKILGKAKTATLQFWVPKGATVADASAGLSLQTSTGEYDIYSVTKQSPKTGSTVKASIAVSGATGGSTAATGGTAGSPSGAAQGSTDQGGGNGAQNLSSLIGLILVIVVAGAAGFFGVSGLMTLRERRAAVEGPGIEEPVAPRDRTPRGTQDRPATKPRTATASSRSTAAVDAKGSSAKAGSATTATKNQGAKSSPRKSSSTTSSHPGSGRAISSSNTAQAKSRAKDEMTSQPAPKSRKHPEADDGSYFDD